MFQSQECHANPMRLPCTDVILEVAIVAYNPHFYIETALDSGAVSIL